LILLRFSDKVPRKENGIEPGDGKLSAMNKDLDPRGGMTP